jgi:hypothetical protein
MRKLLYGTTALATAGLIVSATGDASAAERIKLGISGFHHQYVVGLGQNFRDTDSGRTQRGFTELPIDQKSNTEICFQGSTKLDNGITVGVQVEMEALTRTVGGNNNIGRHIDESWLFLQSPSLGQLKLGVEDPASELLHFVNPNGGISADDGDVINVGFYTQTNGQNATIINTTSIGDAVGDANSVTYITPRWYGFQLGVSYIPIGEDSTTDPAQNNQFGDQSQNGFNRWHSGVSAGGNFQHTFDGGLGIGIKAGLLYMQESEDNKSTGEGGDVTGYDVVGRISYAGFTLGGGFKQLTSGHAYPVATTAAQRVTAFSNRGYAAGGGISYETGPYQVGADCVFGEQVGDIRAGTGNLHHLNCAFSGAYTLGPGIRLVGGVFFFNDGAEDALTAGQAEFNAAADAAIRNTSSTNGVGGVIGITTSF